LVFTAEEVWGTRFPEEGSVHLLEWPVLPERPTGDVGNPDIDGANNIERIWNRLRALRGEVTEAIEPLRRDKIVGSSLAAEVTIPNQPDQADFAEIFISGAVSQGDSVAVMPTAHHKCGRCWRHLPEVTSDGALCSRCDQVVSAMDAAA
ncbi:MAG: isoleucine--tRNA ligase, partial [Novosphingobium sp.]